MSYEQHITTCVADAMVTSPKTYGAETPLEAVQALFEDDHVHMVLIVGADGHLLTAIERDDLAELVQASSLAREAGALAGRTISPYQSLKHAKAILKRAERRRLAVVDGSGRLIGLLCLKRDGDGFCSDEGVRQRAAALKSATA
jgi:CBS-domain-containing membrane protein